MKIWIILQSVIDLILFFIIIGYITRSRKREDERQHIIPLEDISQITDSLKKILTDSENVSFKLAERITHGKRLITAINEKIDKADFLIRKGGTSSITGSGSSEEERYKLVSRLAEEGLGTGEIAKRVGIPEGEVELIVNLRTRE